MKQRRTAVFIVFLLSLRAFAQDKPDALELYRAGIAAEEAGNFKDAADSYTEAIKICLQELQETPKNIDSHVVLGWAYLRLKSYQEALIIAQKGLELAPNDPRLIQVIGEADVFLGRINDGLRNLQESVALRPNENGDWIGRVYWLMGECYIGMREYQNADIALSTALYYQQNKAYWWARLGYAREMANDPKWADDAYSRALKLDPDLTDAVRGKERVNKLSGGG